jgi:serine/threonine protein kinase
VKVIDFGVAKAIDQQLTDKTIYTRFTQMIGTPLYMSPEQEEVNALDVDTRSDVYSLGVVLYELLTGTTPLDVPKSARKAPSNLPHGAHPSHEILVVSSAIHRFWNARFQSFKNASQVIRNIAHSKPLSRQ